jgi:hypothetical protein
MIAPTIALSWDEEESVNCDAQAIITNGTGDHVWLSCTTTIGRGRLIWSKEDDIPVRIEIDAWNDHALEEPRKIRSAFEHISDGDYVVLPNQRRELWFGLEVGFKPRNGTSAIVRYDPDTLDFIDLHEHPTLRTMPWLVFSSTMQEMWTSNFTENFGNLERFDIASKQWLDTNFTLENVPQDEFPQSNIPFIQGADIVSDTLYLISDNYKSSLVQVNASNIATTGVLAVAAVQHIGLGYEREGIAVVERPNGKKWLLCLGNRHQTWERKHFADIVAMQLNDNKVLDSSGSDLSILSLSPPKTYMLLLLGVAFLLGLAVATCGCKSKRRREPPPHPAREPYTELETELSAIS